MPKTNILPKKRSKVIIDLINNNIDVSQALEILDLLLEDINDKKIKKWVDCEISGYSKNDKIPQYRNVPTGITCSYIAGTGYKNIKGTNQTLPIKAEFVEEFNHMEIRDGINEIQQLSIAEKETENHHLTIPLDIQVAQHISLINGQILNANINLSLYAYTNIIGKLKTKLLSIFKELERQYGNLDEYYIDFESNSKKKKTTQNIINIIYDKSTKIGNNNEIIESVLGDENGN